MARLPFALSNLSRRPDRVGTTVRIDQADDDSENYVGRTRSSGATASQVPSSGQRTRRTRRSVTSLSHEAATTHDQASAPSRARTRPSAVTPPSGSIDTQDDQKRSSRNLKRTGKSEPTSLAGKAVDAANAALDRWGIPAAPLWRSTVRTKASSKAC